MRNGATLADEVLQELTDKDDANPIFGVSPQNVFIHGSVHIGLHDCVSSSMFASVQCAWWICVSVHGRLDGRTFNSTGCLMICSAPPSLSRREITAA